MKYEVIKTLHQQSPSLNPAELGVHNLHVKCVKRESKPRASADHHTHTHSRQKSRRHQILLRNCTSHRAEKASRMRTPQISQLIRTMWLLLHYKCKTCASIHAADLWFHICPAAVFWAQMNSSIITYMFKWPRVHLFGTLKRRKKHSSAPSGRKSKPKFSYWVYIYIETYSL